MDRSRDRPDRLENKDVDELLSIDRSLVRPDRLVNRLMEDLAEMRLERDPKDPRRSSICLRLVFWSSGDAMAKCDSAPKMARMRSLDFSS